MKEKKERHFKRKEWKRNLDMYFRPFGVIRLCLIMIAAALLGFTAMTFINRCLGKGTDGILYQVSFALSTGAIASGIVSIVVEMSNNYEKNRKRLRQLSDYFSTIASYEMHKRAMMRTYKEEAEEEAESSGISAWQEAIEQFDKKMEEHAEEGEEVNRVGRTPFEIAGIANQVTKVAEVFRKTHDTKADMLTTEEYEEIDNVLSNVKMICDMLSIALMSDDGQDITEYKKSLFLKRAVERTQKAAFKGKEQLIRLANKGIKYFSHMLNKDDFLYQLDEEYIQEAMYEGIPELKTGIMGYARYLEKSEKQRAPYHELAQKYLDDFLSTPSYMDLETRGHICILLRNFDDGMKSLKEYVKREPLYGYEAEFFEKDYL